MSEEYDYQVRATSCDHRADDEAVYEALRRATAPLHRAWARLQKAGTIAIKLNQDKAPERVVMYDERNRQQLVSDSVARAVFRLLREKTDAKLVCVDCSAYVSYGDETIERTTNVSHLLEEFDVRYADGTRPPYVTAETPRGGLMFEKYVMMQDAIEADEMVSVAVIKSHGFMGITGTLKNLFGLVPGEFHGGKPRSYYHHLVRMPYHLADLGLMFNPALNIVDALVGQTGGEWGDGVDAGRVVDGLIAGDHPIATDACMAHIMGHDPQADWPTAPFHRDRNALRVAAEGGFGTVDLSEIDFDSEIAARPEGTFHATMTDSAETNLSWRRTMCEQALHYRDNRRRFVDAYAGGYILLQDGEVRWHDPSGTIRVSRRELSGEHPDHAMWLKFVDPDEREGEHYEVYERALRQLKG
jgi:uncharacterized protein (DUF362 family)